MEGILLIVLFIALVFGILALILLLRLYRAIKDNVVQAMKEIRADLDDDKELLRQINLEYSPKYSTQDAEPYGSKARMYQEELKKAHDRIFANEEEFRRIRRTLRRQEKNIIERLFRTVKRGVLWYQADRDLYRLRQSIPPRGGNLREVERVLKELDNLPLETADLAKTTQQVCTETKSLLEDLSLVEGIRGASMEESKKSVGEIEKSLDLISPMFYKSTPEELRSTPNIKSETQKAYRALKPASTSLDDLNKKAKSWKSNLEDLRRTTQVMNEKLEEAGAMFAQLDKSLIFSSEREELDSLHQKADQVNTNQADLTGENLAPTLGQARETLAGLVDLTQTFADDDDKLNRLRALTSKVTAQIETAENTMKAATTRQQYPLFWNSSRSSLEDIKGKFAFIPALSERRTPAELTANVLTAEACETSLAKLLSMIEKVRTDLDHLGKLWDQLRPTYTAEWLTSVEALFAKIKVYDMEANWDPADQANSLLSDAQALMQTAEKNIPATSSIPIYEQQVEPKLRTAEDLAEKKPAFDARMSRIGATLKNVQACERDAIGIFRRVAPAVTLFVQRIRSINIPTRPAQAMLAADATKKALEQSLRARNVGRVSKKLEDVRNWEKATGESGAEVYKWFEDDLRKRRDSLGTSLKEIKVFADDLEDDVVVQAHQYELLKVEYPLTVDLVEKKPLDSIQSQFAELFKNWKEVMECQGELAAFIAPIREEYRHIIVDLNNLRANCSRLESDLKREWPPVFQNAQLTRTKVDNLEKGITEIKKLKWERNDLRKNYLEISNKLRDLDLEVNNLRELDRQEADEMTRLEQEYRNKVRECARTVNAGNDAGIRKEIESGDSFLKTLIDSYKNGRRNGTNDPSASDVKARLQRKTEAYKNQILNYNINRMDDLWNEKGMPARVAEVDISVPINRSDFIKNLDRLIADLNRVPNPSLDLQEAIAELQSARQYAINGKPDPASIKRYLNSARVDLEGEKSTPEVATVIADISLLTGTLKTIFG